MIFGSSVLYNYYNKENKKGMIGMVLYLHGNYDGSYSLDEKIHPDEVDLFGDWYSILELPPKATYLDAVEAAKDYGCTKLVLDL